MIRSALRFQIALLAILPLLTSPAEAQHVEVGPHFGFPFGEAVEPLPFGETEVATWLRPALGFAVRVRMSEAAPLAIGLNMTYGQGEIQQIRLGGGAWVNYKDLGLFITELGLYYDVVKSPVTVTLGGAGGLTGFIVDDHIESGLTGVYFAGGTEWHLTGGPIVEVGYTLTSGLRASLGAIYRLSTPEYSDVRPDFDEPRQAEVTMQGFQPFLSFLIAL
jgi:hypothetical protein